MTDVKEMEIILPKENREAVVEVMEFLDELDTRDQRDFLTFLQGARFVMTLNKKNSPEQ